MPTDNPEFQDPPNNGYLSPDTQPNAYGISLPPSHGETYLGLAHGPLSNQFPYGHQEGVSQQLSSPMIANGCPYTLTIDLANTWTSKPSWAYFEENPLKPTIGELHIYGGFEQCSKEELLWTSPPIYNDDWGTYDVILEPSNNYTHMLLVCQKSEEWEKNTTAYILVDNMSAISASIPISISTSTEEFCIEEPFQIEANYDNEQDCTSWDDSKCDKIWTGSGPGNVIFNNNNTNAPGVIVDEYGEYTFTYINYCVGSQSFILEIVPPTVSIDPPESSYCSFELPLSASSSSGIEGSWSTNSLIANVVPGPNNTATLFVSDYGVYDVEYTNCGVSDVVTVEFEPFDPYIIL